MKWLGRIALGLLAVLFASLVFLLGTAPGLQSLLGLADRLAGPGLAIDTAAVEGRLLGRLVLHRLRIETAGLRIDLDEAELDWRPARLLRGEVAVARLALGNGQVAVSDAGEEVARHEAPRGRGPGWLPDVTLESFEVNALRVRVGEAEHRIERLDGMARLVSGRLDLQRLELTMPDLEVAAQGAIDLLKPAVAGLGVTWRWQPAGLVRPVSGNATADGGTEHLQLDLEFSQPAQARGTVELTQIDTDPRWQAAWSIARFNLRQDLRADLPDVAIQAEGEGSGDATRAAVAATGRLVFEGVERPWEITAGLPLVDPAYPELAIRSGRSYVVLSPGDPAVDMAKLQLELPALAELWPGLVGRLVGQGELRGPRARPVIDVTLDGSGIGYGEQRLARLAARIGFDTGLAVDAPLALELSIDGARLAGLNLGGRAQLDGTPADAVLQLQVSESGRGELDLQLSGGLREEILEASIDRLVLGHKDLGRWRSTETGRLRLAADHGEVTLACMLHEGGSFCGGASWQEQRIKARLNLQALSLESLPLLARLTDYRLAGRLDGHLSAQVDGTLVETLEVDIGLSDGQLTHLFPDGEQRALRFREVVLSGRREDERLRFDARLRDELEGQLQTGIALPLDIASWSDPGTPLTGQLNADLGSLDSLNVFLHRANLPQGDLAGSIRLDGSLLAPRFTGDAHLQVPLLEFGEPATVLRQTAVELRLDGSDIDLQGRSELGGRAMRLSARGRVVSVEEWQFDGELEADAIPVAAIPSLHRQGDFTLEGDLLARLEASIDQGLDLERLDARLSLENGSLRRLFLDGEEEQLMLRTLELTARSEQQELRINGRLQDGYDGDLEVALTLPARLEHLSAIDLPLDGHLRADFPRLDIFTIFLEDVTLPQGTLATDIRLAGTRAAPRFTGDARLAVPRLQLESPVIAFDDTRIDLRLDGKQLALDGNSRIEDRPLTLAGRANLEGIDDWNATLDLTGKSLRLEDVFGSRLQASSELVLQLQPGSMKLTGDVDVEGSEIVIRDLSSTLSPSGDIRLVSEEVPATPPWRIVTDLGVRLSGENRLRVAGFNGLLGGNVRIRSETGRLATGQGALTVQEGVYRAFGATVPIRRGRLEFIGGTLDDPAVNIESRRRIEQREVGFDVTGTLRSPVVTLVSSPAMDQSEILSWLLYGRAGADEASSLILAGTIQQALGREEEESFMQRLLGNMGLAGVNVETDLTQGVGLSKQLSPRLFVKYQVDVWEQTNRLILRYQLNERWALEGISGDEGGADILYERER